MQDPSTKMILVEEIENLGSKAVAVKADVSKPQGVDLLIAAAANGYGGLDVLVNNAGIE